MSGKITIYTQVYNTKPYLKQCIESVLNQTYKDFMYIVVNNGCTDGSEELLNAYIQQDTRIHLINNTINKRGFMISLLKEKAKGDYITIIDSDDWWDSDYLERMIAFLENNQLDLSVTGTVIYYNNNSTNRIMRQLDTPVIFTQKQFAKQYPYYWTFPSTYWASIIKTELLRKAQFLKEKLSYGADTINMLSYINQCNRIGIDNSALYHYRIRDDSVSYNYDMNRFKSNIVYYNSISEFLKKHDALDADNQEWLKLVHANSIRMTAETLASSNLSCDEKIDELKKFVEDPLTINSLASSHTDCIKTRGTLLSILFRNVRDQDNLSKILKYLTPKCEPAIKTECISLILMKPQLEKALVADDSDAFIAALLDMIGKNEHTKNYDLYNMVYSLSSDKLLLRDVNDKKFIRKCGNVYLAVWRGKYDKALEMMTNILQNGKKTDETFLWLYVTLAALLEKTDVFLYGKLRSALYYLYCKKYDECRKELNDLAEMGVEDNDEILCIKRELEKVGK